MSIAISDALQQAQQAIESGDYRSAIQTCNRLVSQFPDYAAAYRVLGDAYLEQGQAAEAEQAYAQALLRDPRQAWAYYGLGVIAEEQNVLENALAFCQVAWELAPNYAQLRDPVIRIAARRFGSDGQAQLTSAALAQLYANTARLQRAAMEYRSALHDLPDRVDLKLGLAETLWQLGKNAEAADLCRQVLEENPVAIQALIILADIEGRAGNTDEAAGLRARIRAIDPDGAIAAAMLARNERADRDALLLAADEVPVLDDSAAAVVAERPHIAPAPDFTYQPASAEQQVQDIEDLEPISVEEFGDDFAATVDAAPEVTTEFDTLGVEDEPVEPFAVDAETEADAPSIFRADDDLLSDLEAQMTAAGETEAATPDVAAFADMPADEDLEALLAEFGDVEPMAIEEFGAEPEDVERLAASGEDLLAGDDDLFADLATPFPAEGGADEHVRNLASALEDDVADVLDRTGEFPTVGAEPQEEPLAVAPEPEPEPEPEPQYDAPVDALSGTGYTTVLRELGDEGLTPFDPMGRPDVQEPRAETSELADDAGSDELLSLTENWDDIDDEIARAVPITTGQTDQLRAADDLGIDPFDFELEDDTSRLPAYRPFGEDDDELPELDAEEFAAMTGFPGEPAVEPEAPVVEETPEANLEAFEQPDVVQHDAGQPAEDDLLADLEPFSLSEFEEEGEEEQPFSFGSLPWETGASGSVVPSDEDLDLLLSAEPESEPEPELPLQLEPEPEPEMPPIQPDGATRVLETPSVAADTPVDWTTAIQDDVVVEDELEPGMELEVPHEPEHVSSGWDIPSSWDASLAVTRQIGTDPDDFAERLAAAEEAAQAAAAQVDEVPAPEPVEVDTGTGLLSGVDPEKLVANEDLFERTRSAKTDLIEDGAIRGDLTLEGDQEDVVVEPVSEPEPAPEPEPEPVVVEEQSVEEDFVVATGATTDVATLRASLEAAPDDDELRWWLAEALRERGEIDEAYGQYRWLIRNAGHRSDDVIEALTACIEHEQHAEMGHRLLADIYRRRGAVSLASSHAAAAMAVRRKLRG